MIEEVSAQIWSRPAFHQDYDSLNRASLAESLGIPTESLSIDIGTRLLQCATHFSASSNLRYREAAYRIAIGAWRLFRSEEDGAGKIAQFILSRLGNFPAIDYLASLDSDSFDKPLPLPIWCEQEAHLHRNTRALTETAKLRFTEFQVHLWDALTEHPVVVVTAPTSAGKSFALQHFLCAAFLSGDTTIAVYLVPTRALVTQVSESIQQIFSNMGLNGVEVSVIPSSPEELGSDKVFYVLTQERLQMLLGKATGLNVSRLVVDEAQVLADDSRGIVLQTVVEKLRVSNPDARVFFGSPTTSNPEVFSKVFGLTAQQVQTTESPVTQNLIFVDTNPHRSNVINIRAKTHESSVDLGTIDIGTPLEQAQQILPRLALKFGEGQQNLIYASSPAACEDIAAALVQLLSDESSRRPAINTISDEKKDFAQFLRDQFHQKYFLATAVESGIAFHYGTLPATIRKGIEKLFCDGHLNYLVCTSTLLHGVNLPARNLFLHNPTKGNESGRGAAKEPITSVEFWNLVGRAGRLKKDFEGNVFLIDEKHWQSKPYEGNRRYPVKPSLFVNLLERSERLFQFIEDREHASGKQQGLENTFVKLFNDYRNDQLDETLDRLPRRLPRAVRRKLVDILSSAVSAIRVPADICERNINVSVYRQQEMLEYLVARIQAFGPERVLPIHPSRYKEEVFSNILAIFRRIHTKFEKTAPANNSHKLFALLAVAWMRGETYAQLIQGAYEADRRRRKRGVPAIATVIRRVFENIETDVRFRYVKFTNCYIDLLRHALSETSCQDFISRIPSLPLYLELGASSETMISLIGAGISRTTAGILAQYAPRPNMTRHQVLKWLGQADWEEQNIPLISIHEIREALRE